METARERFYFANTMLCLLKAIEGQSTTVELRDEKEVFGKIIQVDGYMNITMANVTLKTAGCARRFDRFFVNGRLVRYVHIPDEVDMRSAMEGYLQRSNQSAAQERVKQDIKDAAWHKMAVKEKQRQHRMKKENK